MRSSRFMALALLAVAACGGGTLSTPTADAGCTPGSCPEGERCVDGRCQPELPAGDPCDVLLCPEGQECRDGRCWTVDLCAGVTCTNPGEVCDPRDGACHAGAADDDGDGVTIAEGDCDDGDPAVHPGAAELCDGRDQNCDRIVDDGFADADGDGFDVCGAGNPAQADCDDSRPTINPAGTEVCDGLDQDCDGAVDDGLAPRPCRTACGSGEERCEGGEWFCSAPETCECTPAGAVEDESCGRCGSRERACLSDLTWGPWSTCTGEGECSPGDLTTCLTSCGSVGERTCDAACSFRPCVPPAESCNAADDDCDGVVDDSSCLVPIYRFYNGSTGDHMYKAESTAPDAGYVLEPPVFYLYRASVPGTVELFQCFNGTDHMMVVSPADAAAVGYVDPTSLGHIGLAGASDVGDRVATEACRYYNSTNGDHMVWTYLTDEELASLAPDYVREVCGYYYWLLPSP